MARYVELTNQLLTKEPLSVAELTALKSSGKAILGMQAYTSDGYAGSPGPVHFNGTDWKRMDTGATIST